MNVPSREKKGESALARLAAARRRSAAVRPRWASLAGSILAGVLVGTWLWAGQSRNSLATDLLEHIEAEPSALTDATPPEAVARVLERAGVRRVPAVGQVSYARTCRLRGRPVPHLVLRAEGGPVTVLVLRHERVDAARSFTGSGFSGRIVPDGPGSIAVVATAGADLDAAVAHAQAAVDWAR